MKVFENFVQKLDVENKERLKLEKNERGIIFYGECMCRNMLSAGSLPWA